MNLKRTVFLIISALILLLSAITVEKTGKLHYYAIKYGGVYPASDGNTISLYDYHGKEAFLKNFDTVSKFIKDCPLETYVAIPPRKMDVLIDSLPEDFPHFDTNALFKLAKKECEKKSGNYIDLLPVFSGKSEYAGHLYFKTDHHWTSKGAYLAYREIITAMGKTPLEESDFDILLFTEKYRGSDYTKHPTDEYDSIFLYYSKNYSDFQVTSVNFPYESEDNNTSLSGMYLEDRRESFDPYTVYFGGNTAYITIRKDQRDTLLIIRDSFASSLAPFLAEHYDIVMIDPRFYPASIKKLAEKESVDLVLILENMGSFTENTIKFKY